MQPSNPTTDKSSQCLVLFGALGDLSLRKLFPALFQLHLANLLPDNITIIAIARRDIGQDGFIEELKNSLSTHGSLTASQKQEFISFSKRLDYTLVDMTDEASYSTLSDKLAYQERNITFYLATPPNIFGDICRNLNHAGLTFSESRIVLEKPIGTDLASSKHINDTVGLYFNEEQIYRIDHYLGKETVQNLLALRFANPIFGNLWNHQNISYIEISVAEEVGIEGRWGYFDDAGQMRDMVQNHLLQLLCLVAMEPPARLDADSIRNEKVRVLEALKSINVEEVNQRLIRGQYSNGSYDNTNVPGYLEEPDANEQSITETYIALRVDIANWRWANTPFYLRTGKRLHSKVSEIIIHFQRSPHFIFDKDQQNIADNKLVIRLQPSEGISLQTLTKEQGIEKGMRLRQDLLHLDFAQTEPNKKIPDAYERLLLAALMGNQSLFVRRDEVEAAWQWCDQLRTTWEGADSKLHEYPAGSYGPEAADKMIQAFGHCWYEHC